MNCITVLSENSIHAKDCYEKSLKREMVLEKVKRTMNYLCSTLY
jgi:hypothetical protein